MKATGAKDDPLFPAITVLFLINSQQNLMKKTVNDSHTLPKEESFVPYIFIPVYPFQIVGESSVFTVKILYACG